MDEIHSLKKEQVSQNSSKVNENLEQLNKSLVD